MAFQKNFGLKLLIGACGRKPEEAWCGRKPTVNHFRIFGCIAYADIPNKKRSKFDDKGEKCIFLGVSDQSKAYKLYNPTTKKIIISHDVFLMKKDFGKIT